MSIYWSLIILAICLISAFIVAVLIIKGLIHLNLIKIILVIAAIVLPIAWAQDEVAVKPLALGDGLKTVGEIAISKDAVAGIPYLGGWQDEAAWRAGMLSWLAWMPNNSTNRSLIA